MKKLFYIGLVCLSLFEFLNVYFIMPMPGSQEIYSIDLAYFLYTWRWVFRILFIGMVVAGCVSAFQSKRKWIPGSLLLVTAGIIYLFNFQMSADKMFLQAEKIEFKSQLENKLDSNRLVIGVEHNGEAKAYPISYLIYHHQVYDHFGGKPVMITYCSVCRSGRVFDPRVNGKYEKFRLVGMDHFNAMFEDESTGSWWRQATGEAITGPLKGTILPEIESRQMTVKKWFELFPSGMIMQADEFSIMSYDSLANFEQGKSKGRLTRTDSLSWKDKSWIVGIQIGNVSKAYDWNELRRKRIIHDTIGGISIVIVVSSDEKSFAAFEIPANQNFTLRNDSLFSVDGSFDFKGRNVEIPSNTLRSITAYQEFWHSWLTFHPNTLRYN